MKKLIIAAILFCGSFFFAPHARSYFGSMPPHGLYLAPASTTWNDAVVSVIDTPPVPSGCFGGGGTNYFNVSRFFLKDPAGTVFASSALRQWPYNMTSTLSGIGFATPPSFDGTYQLAAQEGEWAPCGTWYDIFDDGGMGWFSWYGGTLAKVAGPPTPSLAGIEQHQESSTMPRVAFGATLQSSSTDLLQLQIELRPVNANFTGVPNVVSALTTPGSVIAPAPDLPDGAYHWRARVWDSADQLYSAWEDFGGTGGEDFDVQTGSIWVPEELLHDADASFSCRNGYVGAAWNIFCGSVAETASEPFVLGDIMIEGDGDASTNNHAVPPEIFMTVNDANGAVIATSTNACAQGYRACGGFDFTFDPIAVPARFTVSIMASSLQGYTAETYSGITVRRLAPGAQAGLDPVVIVPGIFGSEYRDGEWILQPRLAPYGRLEEMLIANGYAKDATLFEFPYDWRQSNLVSAHKLKNKIEEIRSVCGCSKVDVVAHSMGGLVARQYIESNLYGRDIDQLIFLGTPQLGATDAYFAWDGGTGDFGNGLDLTGLYMKALLYQESVETGQSFELPRDVAIFNYLHAAAPSFSELLPIYDYLHDVENSSVRIYPNGYPRNAFLEDLNASSSVAALSQSGVRVTTMYGNDDPTPGVIHVDKVPAGPLWADGVPKDVEKTSGDGTVLEASALGMDIGDEIRIASNHFGLPSAAAGDVVRALTGTQDPVEVPEASKAKMLLSIFALSPVDVLVKAPDGMEIGVAADPEKAIAGAYYSGAEGSNENIFIPDPLEGEYAVMAKGVASGTYHLMAVLLYETSSSVASVETAFEGVAQPGKESSFKLLMDPLRPEAMRLAPNVTHPPRLQVCPAP